MALVLADRVLETTSVAGTGDASLNGAVTGYQPFSVIGGGNTTYYTIVAIDDNGIPTGDWEVGIGTYVISGNKISRDTVLSSSNGGALVYFASGNKQIFLDLPSEELPVASGDVTGPASAVANNFAAFNMTTGKLIKDSGYNASSFATAAQGTLADTAIQPGDLGTAAYLDAGSALGVATLDAGGKVPTSQIPQMGDLNYQGTWNASTNSPTLTSSAGTKGFYYVVSVAGSTNLNGITDWKVGDWAVFNGSVWEKIDNTDAVTSVNGYTGTVVLTASDVGATPVTSGTSILYGNGFGGTSNVTIGTGVAFVGGTLSATGSGGDVVGPSSATDNAIARFDGTTGKLIQNSAVTLDDAGNIIGADSVQFSGTIPTGTISSGTLYFDSSNNSLNFQQNNITQQIGEELFIYGKASAAITEGQLICKTGAVGASGAVTFGPSPANLVDNDGIIGVATENIALNGFGRITSFGVVHGINTTGSSVGETWADGDTLWYNPAGSGKLTNVKPTAPNIKYSVATVTHAGPGNSGSIQVYLEPGSTLGGTDSNVELGTLAAAQLLTYSTTDSYWKNTALTAGTGISVGNAASGVITVTNSAPDQTVAITGAGGAVVTGTYPNFTVTTPSGTVTSVTGTAPIASTGGATPAISISQATTSTDGYLSSTDWNTFNNKQPAGSYLTTVTAGTPLSGSGTVGSPLVIAQATTSTSGYLSSTDWNTFNNKGSGTVTSVTGTAPIVSSGGATPAISMAAATTSVNGYLTSTDWNTFNGKYSTGGALGTPSSGTLTNCTGYTYANLSGTVPTWNQDTTGKSAKTDALNSATTTINVSSATAPSAGQALIATSSTAATWQTIAASQWTTTGSNIYYSTGKVGIGAAPTYTFDVTGSAANSYIGFHQNTAGTADDNMYLFRMGASANSANATFLYCQTSTTQRFTIKGNGGIANYQANDTNLSDERVKKDIVDAGNYLDRICSIPVKTFLYKDQSDTFLNLGVIAQDVETVAPELVDASGFGETPDDGVPLKSIYQTDLQYALMKSIQELKAIVDAQAARITELEAK